MSCHQSLVYQTKVSLKLKPSLLHLKHSGNSVPMTSINSKNILKSYQHTRFLPGPPAAAWSWTKSVRCWVWGRGRGNGKGKGRERWRDSRRVHQMSSRQQGWHDDSVDSTTPSGWSAACPSWHSVVCGLNGRVLKWKSTKGENSSLAGVMQTEYKRMGVCIWMHLTQGKCVGALGGNGESDNEVRAWRVGVDQSVRVSPELQNSAHDLHHIRGAKHRPVKQTDFCVILML